MLQTCALLMPKLQCEAWLMMLLLLLLLMLLLQQR